MRQPLGGWENGFSPKTINNFRQNTPELVIRDAKRLLNLSDAECDVLRQILLARGVNKWLYCRRLLIELKHELRKTNRNLSSVKGNRELKNFVMQLTGKVRAICHHPRWVEWPPIATASNAAQRVIVRGKNA